jgi:DNA-binding FadR family transcriptional regulator
MNNEELIQLMATATRIACATITSAGQAALQASLDQARATPVEFGWERKAAAHAGFFNALADAAPDSCAAPVLNFGAGYVYDLMISSGRAADGIVVNSRRRMLAHLRAGDHEEAAYEMEKHLRVLRFMRRLAARPSPSPGARVSPGARASVDADGVGVGVGVGTSPVRATA